MWFHAETTYVRYCHCVVEYPVIAASVAIPR
jgi:hypothetical protein